MKDMRMKNILKLTSAMVFVGASAFAASSNVTVSSSLNPYIGTPPATGYISATITSTTQPRAALPSTSKVINSLVCNVRDANNYLVPRGVFISGTDVWVTTAPTVTSGTLAVGDKLNCFISYER